LIIEGMLKALIQVQGVFAELDKSMLVAKLRKSREAKKAKTGRCEGRKPYGFYPGEDKIVKRVKELRRKPHGERRKGYRTIAKQLNKEGIPTRSGVPWSDSQIKSILTRKK